MKVKYTTNRETAAILREMASNCGSSEWSLGDGFTALKERQGAVRARSIEDYMTGEANVTEPTGEAVMRAFQNCRTFRAKTIARLAPTIVVEVV